MPDGIVAPAPPPQPGGDRVEEAVRAVLGSLSGDMTVTEAALLSELEALGREVARAKTEIAALQVEDITASHIPAATDELDAVVAHTATATNEILDCCEVLERLQPGLGAEEAAAVSGAVTRIYEACGFQDITGQRISKVVNALKAIERRVDAVAARFGTAAGPRAAAGPHAAAAAAAADTTHGKPPPRTEGEALANGPQLPTAAASQAEIDRLLASFD